eukprot:g14047.t1
MLCTEALKKAKTFKAQNIANTLNACSKLDYNPGEEVLRMLCTEALKKAKTFNAQGIANTLNACSKLDYNPGEEVLRTLCAEALNKANTFTAQGIANTLNACAMLNYNPGEEVLRTLCAEALKKADTFKLDQQSIANTLHACMMLNHGRDGSKRVGSRILSTAVLRASLASMGASLFRPYPTRRSGCRFKLSFLCNPAKSYEFHKEVTKTLRDAEIPHVNEDTSSGLWADIGLIEHKVVIEVDGPTHFVSGGPDPGRKFTFLTLYKHRLLRAMGRQRERLKAKASRLRFRSVAVEDTSFHLLLSFFALWVQVASPPGRSLRFSFYCTALRVAGKYSTDE